MNILVLAPHPFFQNRGTPIAVKLLCQVLAGRGHCITLLSYHEGEAVDIANVEHHRIPNLPGVKGVPPGFSWKKLICDAVMFVKCCMLLRRLRVDVIHAVEESAFMAAGFRCLLGIPYIYDMDSSLAQQLTDRFPVLRALRPLLSSLERVAIRRSAGVIAVCRSLEDIARLEDGRKRVLRLEDISLLAENAEPAENIRESLALKGLIVMYIGNLEHYQGIDLLLESVQLAATEVAAVELVVVGGSVDHIDQYRRKAGELGIEKRTHFLGPRPIEQLNSLLSQADILVSPRISGGNTPMKIYSYLASGKPLLATRLYTHTQVLNDDVAELVDPEPAAMSRGMIRLLQSSDYAEALGRRGQKMANTEYSYPQYEAKLVQFYDAVQESMHVASAENHGLKLPMKKAR